ncbi:endopolyphosphatase [Malassezia furfur]|uniref:Endopolyphosphatase n=1 Tax=Malassezia furfur TaxID=55194 RepID=A0ABY8ET37_MALFU|nr:PPN1 [Malassezia furfur]WFD48229.1 endopolyphosphatase [Malassezia furfur]
MVWKRGVLALCAAVLVAAVQEPYVLPMHEPGTPLSGRFLHITDMHLDSGYKEDSAVVSSCHHNKPHDKHGGEWRAGHWGTPVSDCDSPLRLGNATLDWVARNWNVTSADRHESVQPKDMFDFVLWTGDSARHDQDPLVPRTGEQTLEANRFAVDLMERTFPDIPIVPNIGNNDIALHNIMPRGPNKELRQFLDIWRKHIPEDQTKTFLEGGYFAKDLIPDHLGVLSLNTLYFFDSNKGVDGCPKRRRYMSRDEADIGTLQLEWMTQQLLHYRRRNMQVHIIGHVPATAGNYFPRCFDVYTELVLRFQDTIVGQHFGHMNLDMFFIQESTLATDSSERKTRVSNMPVLMKRVEEDLRLDYESLPGRARTNMDYYAAFYVSPSVIPTYYPSVRVWTYNTTPVHDNRPGMLHIAEEDEAALLDYVRFDSCTPDDTDPDCAQDAPTLLAAEPSDASTQKKQRQHSRPKRRSKHRHHKLPRYASPDAPVRKNTFLTPLGYSQWVLDLPKANKVYEKTLRNNGSAAAAALQLDFDLEYATYPGTTLWHEYFDDEETPASAMQRHHHRLPSQHHIPVPRHLLERKLRQLRMDSPLKCHEGGCHVRRRVRHLSEYELQDMTLRSVMDWARRLVLSRRLWRRFVHRMYANSLLNA